MAAPWRRNGGGIVKRSGDAEGSGRFLACSDFRSRVEEAEPRRWKVD